MCGSGNIRIYYECEDGIIEACRVMTKGGRDGQIFLSHPHTNNGFFFLLTTKIHHYLLEKHKKDFQKILNTLRCHMVKSF